MTPLGHQSESAIDLKQMSCIGQGFAKEDISALQLLPAPPSVAGLAFTPLLHRKAIKAIEVNQGPSRRRVEDQRSSPS